MYLFCVRVWRQKPNEIKENNMKDKTQTKDSQSSLALEYSKLTNLQLAANMRNQEFHMACDQIEHARRNVEVISRVYNSFSDDEGREIQAKIKEVLLSNLEMLKETNEL